MSGVIEMEQHYTVQQLAEMLSVDEEQILAAINSGELPAVNVAKSLAGKRPRWRVAESEAGKYLLRRRHPASIQPAPPKAVKRPAPKQYV